jgi:hypothetical protein
VLREACAKAGVSVPCYWKRRRKGMTHEEALNTPVLSSNSKAWHDQRRQRERDQEASITQVNQLLRAWKR